MDDRLLLLTCLLTLNHEVYCYWFPFVCRFIFFVPVETVSSQRRTSIKQFLIRVSARCTVLSHKMIYKFPGRSCGNRITFVLTKWGARCWWRSWLRHCATNRKVAGLIPDGVIGLFHWHNPSGCTMALQLTQPLTEMSTRNISWG
jgi:hypothetical protein